MKGFFGFVKTTVAGGFFVILPIAVVALLLGQVLAAQGDLDAAYTELSTAVRLNPHGERVLVSLAQVLAGLGRTEEALQSYAAADRERWAREGILARWR